MRNDNKKQESVKWEVSQVKCDLCAHEWVAVRPQGTPKLECPNCSNISHFENIKTDGTIDDNKKK